MAYQYYQSSYPDWGRRELQFGTSPIPNIRPHPSWNGWDYYEAYGVHPDPSLFFSLMSRVREYGTSGGMGVNEARAWHHSIYSGLAKLSRTLPADIGAAAAYETHRMWKHHHNELFEYVHHDREKEREALIGLTVAEASRLWHYSGRPMDARGLRETLESAALTAARVLSQVIGSGHHTPSRMSFEGEHPDHHYSRQRRHSSVSFAPPLSHFGRSPSSSPHGTPHSVSIPISGHSSSSHGHHGHARHASGSSPRSYGNTLTVPGYDHGVIPGNPSSYGHSSSHHGHGHSQPHTASGHPIGRTYTISGSGGAVTIPSVPPGSTIIIQQPSKHSSSSSKSKSKHHRSHSSEPIRVSSKHR